MAEWKAAISHREFLAWAEFYRHWPFDDLHRHHRPAALVAASNGGGTAAEMLEWLQPEPVPDGMSQADLNTLKTFGIKR